VDAAGLKAAYEGGLDVDEVVRNDFGEAESVAEGSPPRGDFQVGSFP
jgi:hypothetical protein